MRDIGAGLIRMVEAAITPRAISGGRRVGGQRATCASVRFEVPESTRLLKPLIAGRPVIGRVAAVITGPSPAAIGLRIWRDGRIALGNDDGCCRHAFAFYQCEKSCSIGRVQTDTAM